MAQLTSAFILTKKLQNGSILGWPQKTYSFSDAEFIYCQKNGRKWSLMMGNTLIEIFSFLIFSRKFLFGKKTDTHLDFSVSTFLYHAFTVLYSHNQHAYVTPVEVFVNVRRLKSEDRLFVQSLHLSSARRIVAQRTRYLEAR